MAPVDRECPLEGVVLEDVDAGIAAALEGAAVLVEDGREFGGAILNAGEKLTLLELLSSRILNLYSCVVGMSEGMRKVALPLFSSVAVWQKLVSSVSRETR